MSLQLQYLRDKINSARNLLGVVETMRGLAAVNIRRAEGVAAQSTRYARTVHVAMHATLTSMEPRTRTRWVRQANQQALAGPTTALLITTDMGLCGQFNERIVDYALDLARREAKAARAAFPRGEADGAGSFRWLVVGMRGWERLRDTDAELIGLLDAPSSVEAVGAAVEEAFVALSGHLADGDGPQRDGHRLLIVHNVPDNGSIFAPRHLQLLPFQPNRWLAWPGDEPTWKTPPLTALAPEDILPHLVREQVYIDLFEAFILSFAAENAARLSSMRNATDNIEEVLAELEARYRRERQDVITNELMELLGGVEAVAADE